MIHQTFSYVHKNLSAFQMNAITFECTSKFHQNPLSVFPFFDSYAFCATVETFFHELYSLDTFVECQKCPFDSLPPAFIEYLILHMTVAFRILNSQESNIRRKIGALQIFRIVSHLFNLNDPNRKILCITVSVLSSDFSLVKSLLPCL